MRNNTYNALTMLGAVFVAIVALVGAGLVLHFVAERTPEAPAPMNCTYTYDDRNGVGSITVTWDAETCSRLHQRAERR